MNAVPVGKLFTRFTGILEPDFDGIEPQFRCNYVQLGFHRKTYLGCTVAALRGAQRIIGIDGVALVFQMGQPVGNHDKSPRQEDDHDPAPAKGPAIINDPELLGNKRSVLFDTGFDFHNQRLTMTIGRKDFFA